MQLNTHLPLNESHQLLRTQYSSSLIRTTCFERFLKHFPMAVPGFSKWFVSTYFSVYLFWKMYENEKRDKKSGTRFPLVDLRGPQGRAPPSAQILSFSCSFPTIKMASTPTLGVGAPFRKILDPPLFPLNAFFGNIFNFGISSILISTYSP